MGLRKYFIDEKTDFYATLGFRLKYDIVTFRLMAHLSLAKIPSTLKSLTFSDRRAKTSTHYEEPTKTILDHIN